MSNYPAWLDEEPAVDNTEIPEEPDWPTVDYTTIEPPDEFNDEPPLDWEFPVNMLTPLSVETAPVNLPQPDTDVDIQAQLAAVERQLALNEANENTIERSFIEDQLREELEGLSAELAADPELTPEAPSRQDLMERANDLGLYDARFVGKDALDAEGNPVGHTLQSIEIYQDTDGAISGKVLDIGHYTDQAWAEQDYFKLQEAVLDGSVPDYTVAALGEMVASELGLGTTWREATPEDLELYWKHVELDTTQDVPPPHANMDQLATGAIAIANAEQQQALRDYETVEQQQAIEALMETGLQPPDDFNLQSDSYLDEETGQRYLTSIFQTDFSDDSAGCQATLIELSPDPEGAGQKACVVPIGTSGSYDAAYQDWSTVNTALNEHGLEGALEAMDQIEAQISLEPMSIADIAQMAMEEAEPIQAEPNLTHGFEIGGM
ncbi:MAG: hypothetical protein ABI947_04570 [Chloroflexota bacterium]